MADILPKLEQNLKTLVDQRDQTRVSFCFYNQVE